MACRPPGPGAAGRPGPNGILTVEGVLTARRGWSWPMGHGRRHWPRCHHVVVRQDEAVLAEDDAGALLLAVAHGDLELHHAGQHLGGDLLDRTRRRADRGLGRGLVGNRGCTGYGRRRRWPIGLIGQHQRTCACGCDDDGGGAGNHDARARTFARRDITLELVTGLDRDCDRGRRAVAAWRTANRVAAGRRPGRDSPGCSGPQADSAQILGLAEAGGSQEDSSCRGSFFL